MESHRRSWCTKPLSGYLSPLQRGAWWCSNLAENLPGTANAASVEEEQNGLKGRRPHTLKMAGLGRTRTTQPKTEHHPRLSQKHSARADVLSCAMESGGTPRWVRGRPAQMVSLNSLGNVYLVDKFRFLEQSKQMLSGSVFEASLSERV